jgi:hypothetical protein
MAGNLSDWAENALMDWLMGGANPTRPTTRYVALHTGDPGESGASNEVGAGVGYARQAVTFSAASGGACSNAANVVFGPASGAGFGTVTHITLWDDEPGGNCLWSGPLAAGQAVAAGVSFTIVAGDLDLALD